MFVLGSGAADELELLLELEKLELLELELLELELAVLLVIAKLHSVCVDPEKLFVPLLFNAVTPCCSLRNWKLNPIMASFPPCGRTYTSYLLVATFT